VLAISLTLPNQVLVVFEQFDDPAKKALSVVLFRWMMPYLLLVSVSAVMMAVQNSHNRFFTPAITPIVFSVCVISSILIGSRNWGPVAIGVGVMAGGIAQIAVQFPNYRRLGYRLRPEWGFRDPAFRRVMKKWAPMLVTSSLFAVNNQVAMLLASFLPDKSPSALANAIVFFQLPFGLFSASITTVLYPKMSRQAARNDIVGLKESLGFGYRNLWALLVPSAMALILLGEPIVAIAFQRRAFSLVDTQLTARVLTAYSVGMPFVGLFNITQRAFYAMGEVRTPFYCALAAVALDILLSLVFVFALDGGPESLAWANTAAFVAACVLQYGLLKRRTGFAVAGHTIRTGMRVILGTIAGAGVVIGGMMAFGNEWWKSGSSWSGFGLLMLIASVSGAVILGLYHWMNVEAVSIILRRGGGHGSDEEN
jgi:putative peptidoglycan lipid II flippase